jgi:hypothetical protein
VPRKDGPDVTRSELLIVNKTDLAPFVGADLSVMDRDANHLRGDAPTSLPPCCTATGWKPSSDGCGKWSSAATGRLPPPPRGPNITTATHICTEAVGWRVALAPLHRLAQTAATFSSQSTV